MMNVKNAAARIKPYCYRLILSRARKIDRKLLGGKPSNFTFPVTSRSLPKIYVLKVSKRIVYVGYTSQPLNSRFNVGLRANGEGGYYGYQWRKYKRLDLLIFCFDLNLIPRKKPEEFVQAIEAEIVFQVRSHSEEWPECQNEIHFFNRKGAKEMGMEIYKKYLKG